MPASKPPRVPSERSQTVRDALCEALRGDWATARELSTQVGVAEKDVATHLGFIERSLKRTQERLRMDPASCVACGFIFAKRDRLTRPARCPVCNSERITPPRFRVETE